ncbi:unnamed protein product [Vicia faba]|uniref:Uncharacterized protein n=1 Tax=Vicia faba TaxID=3906 RepID=A0AAV0YIF6_VICFA|nr:unnamed protein product [Vicia faba]
MDQRATPPPSAAPLRDPSVSPPRAEISGQPFISPTRKFSSLAMRFFLDRLNIVEITCGRKKEFVLCNTLKAEEEHTPFRGWREAIENESTSPHIVNRLELKSKTSKKSSNMYIIQTFFS